MAGTRDVSVSESREPTIMIVFIFRLFSDFISTFSFCILLGNFFKLRVTPDIFVDNLPYYSKRGYL